MNLCKRIIPLTVAACVLVPSLVFANYWSGGRSSPVKTAYYDSSVSSYGYTPHFDEARNAWSIPLKVNISKSSSNASTYDEYYVGSTAVVDRLGLMIPYKDSTKAPGLKEPATELEQWKYSVVSLYVNYMTEFGYNDRVGVAVHEVGHSLSLSHTSAPYQSVMFYSTYAGNPIFKPTSYDIGQLKTKWGIQ